MRVDIRPYRRPFRQPLQTAHGLWAVREGIILRFEDEQGQVIFGEIAPIPWFGTETLEQARAWCDRCPRHFSLEQIDDIPDSLPACQFGFGAASPHPLRPPLPKLGVAPCASRRVGEARQGFPAPLLPKLGEGGWGMRGQPEHPRFDDLCVRSSQAWARDLSFENLGHEPRYVCALLPTGAAALAGWQSLWQAGHRTFKWKIGVAALEEELSLFQQLVKAVPSELRLRLDANGGLAGEEAETWLALCDRAPITIEFLEQPLPPATILDWLPQAKKQFQTAIAVDESVATFRRLQQVYEQVGRQVVYVVKPAIAGRPQQLAEFCLQHRLDVVFSSALETPVGCKQVMQLAHTLWAQGTTQRALGFGVGHWFADNWSQLSEASLWARL